jgi:adenylate cyclase
MIFRLKTVRAKLTMLVALSIVVMLAMLPVLSWLLHKQLLDEVDGRVVNGQKSFDAELTDDLSDLTIASRVITNVPETELALRTGDTKAAHDLAEMFLKVYPDVDILFADKKGAIVAQVGCNSPPTNLSSVAAFANVLKGVAFQGVIEHGCERSDTDTPPTSVIAVPVKDVGAVVVCMPLDQDFLSNASTKLGLELAFVRPADRIAYARTNSFPNGSARNAKATATLFDSPSGTWAVSRFSPTAFSGKGSIDVVTALDVDDIRAIVRRNLYYAFGVLAVAAIISLFAGIRVARAMSSALTRVNRALKKLEKHEYAYVEGVKSGDELEDLANGFNQMVDGLKERDTLREDRDKIKATFGKYMTAALVDSLMTGVSFPLGGESRTVTILFTDIRSFTTISEKMDAQELVGLLNEYFTEMVAIVMDEGGVVDKYIGDAIMVVFGAPIARPDDPLHAVRAAVRMRRALVGLNKRLVARGKAELKTGIGIHTGEVVSGNIGHERRMEYTVIGDAVNLASRLESSTKELGVNVLISEDTYQLTKDKINARQIREITVKGRKQPVMTYEVEGIKGEAEHTRDSFVAPEPVNP